MDVKGEVLLQLLNKSKLKNGTKTLLKPKFFKFKKLGFSAPLCWGRIRQTERINLFVKTKTKIRKAIQTGQYQITIIKLVGKRKT